MNYVIKVILYIILIGGDAGKWFCIRKRSKWLCRGVGTASCMLFESVSEYGSPVARVDVRTRESQRGRNGLSWFGPIDALRLVADDPYAQKHPKSGVTIGL